MESASASSIGHRPEPGQRTWAFDAAVTEVFEDMLRRSIPQYDVMRELTFSVGSRFLRHGQGDRIMDLGASRGDGIRPFLSRFGALARYTLLDVSEPMLGIMRRDFQHWINAELLEVLKHDLREGLPMRKSRLVLSVLTLQFTPINYRHMILRECWERLEDGGALIFVEKVLGEDATSQDLLVDEYHALKERAGYSREEIDAKREALEGVLVPMTASWNVDALERAGFRTVECFWRCLSFAGWVAVKGAG